MNPYQQALKHYQAGQTAQAAQILQSIIRVNPNYAPAWHLMSVIAHKNGHLDKAVEFINKAAKADNKNGEIQSHRAELLRLSGDLENAVKAGRRAVKFTPKSGAAHNNLGLVLQEMRDLGKAQKAFRQAIQQDPNYVRAYYNLATILHEDRESRPAQEEAAALLKKALTLNPNYMKAHLLMGMVLNTQGHYRAAEPHFRRAYELNPENPKYYLNYGNALAHQQRNKEAVTHYYQAIAKQPNYPEAYFGLGSIAKRRRANEEARDFFQNAIDGRPDWADAWHSLADTLNELNLYPEAKEAYLKALELRPNTPEFLASLVNNLSAGCDWSELDSYFQQLYATAQEAIAHQKKTAVSPFRANIYSFTSQEKFLFARSETTHIEKQAKTRYPDLIFSHPEPDPKPGRLRIGYLSYDFRDHAVSHLMRTVFAHHDRDRFEIFTYSYSAADEHGYQAKIKADSEHFIDMREVQTEAFAQRIYDDQIHILVDLMGYTGQAKPDITVLRPAPIHINYLGFPGTMGSDLWDYIITDKNTTPPEDAPFFGEQLAYVPTVYQCTDHRQPIDPTPVTRAAEGLPEEGVVFVSFNTAYKIEPTRFAAWMRILEQVPDSVLWLLTSHQSIQDNLRREAAAHGIDPDRLVFAGRKQKVFHLARFQLADLFLDTRYYNAHTTASDSLWAGVPLLTCPEPTFSGRVSASILKAAALPELIMPDIESYVREAVRLGNDPAALAALKAKLKQKIQTSALFDTLRWTRNLENLYEAIWSRHAAGDPPAMIEAADSGPSGIDIAPDKAL